MKHYFSLLDGVRFFAAFWVMNFHYLLGLGLDGDVHWYRYGNLGVQLFFIISGFVIVQSLQHKPVKEFATGRAIRLFPLFWILCTLTYILTLVVPSAASLQFSEYLFSMTMLGDVIEGVIHHGGLIDPSYWTLCVELLFYISIGVFVWLFSFKQIRYFFAAWLLISVVVFAYHGNENFYSKLLLVSHSSYFIFGGALALLSLREVKHIFEKWFDWILLVVAAFYATHIHAVALHPYSTYNVYDNQIVTILHVVFFVSVPLLVYASTRIKNIHVLHLLMILGGLTYPLYLLHQTIGNTLINYITNTFHVPRPMFVVFFEGIIIAVAYGVSIQDKKLRGWLQHQLFVR